MEGFKLTNMKKQTRGGMQWGEEVEWEALGPGVAFCSPDLIHFYDHPLLAILHNPLHVNYIPALLWRGEASGQIFSDRGMKWGCKRFRTLEQIPLPVVTENQRVAYGILCALAVYPETNWVAWAQSWLDGTDRSRLAAHVAAEAAADRTGEAASTGARAATRAASAAYAIPVYAIPAAALAAYAAQAAANVAMAMGREFRLLPYAEAALLVKEE